MVISAPIFEAYLKCPSKCWFLFLDKKGDANIYPDFLRKRNNAYRVAGIERLMAKIQQDECVVKPSVPVNLKTTTWLLAIDLVARKESFESCLHVVERIPTDGQGKPAQFIPIRFIFTNKITKNDKLVLAFDALVLSEMFRIDVSHAKIIYGNCLTTLKVRTSDLLDEVRKLTGEIVKLLASKSPPDLILNRHCAECEYQAQCRQKAIEKDDLSLLYGMNKKERNRLNSKGIFTVTQLSYTFRQRRRNKRLKARHLVHYPALQALAIREKRVYILQRPDVPHARTLVFVDMEGDTDSSSIYLIGVLVVENGKQTPSVFWADTHTAEKKIFAQFSELLSRLDDVHLFYYGSYESRVFKRMLSLASTDRLRDIFLNRSTNVLSMIYSRIYFPTYSNRLKEIGQYVGSTWSDPASSGLQSIVWRTQWEVSHDEGLKNSLIRYNMEDCNALKTIAEFIDALPVPGHPGPDSSPDVGFADDVERDKSPNRYEWGNRASAFEEYGNIVKYAYFEYQRSKVCVRTDDRLKKIVAQVKRSKRKPFYRINARVELKLLKCHYCKSNNVFRDPINNHVRDVFDLRFFPGGIKRWVTRYTAPIHTCLDCGMKPVPLRYRKQKMFGHGLMAWAMQQHVSNRISYEDIAKTIHDSFGIPIGAPRIYKFKQALARYYEPAYRKLLQKIMDGRVLHADETTVKLQRSNGYVWVFASPEEVVYIYKANRKADFLHDMLKDFKGILITDFYTGYDSLPCLQQKCLIHLIRDMNECLLKSPFDQELEGLARRFGGLLQKIVDTIDKRGLKSRYLRKYKNDVQEYFNELSARTFISETAEKLRQRMLKYQSKLFLFLDYDGVPWNNNYGEHAIKPFARYRRVVTGQINERGLCDYLLLLSLYATCVYRGIRFLDFLLSKELYLDDFSYRKK